MLFFRFRKTSPISSLEPGTVVIIEGTVVPKTELSLRGTGDKCVFYALTQESFRLSERGGRKLWLVDQYEQQASGFYLDDGTGKLYIPIQPVVMDMRGGHVVTADIGGAGQKRIYARIVRGKDRLRLHGTIDKPYGKEPSDSLVLRPAPDGKILGLAR